MIIWPASTHRSNWTTHPTPGWHFAYSDSGYTDAYLSLRWLKLVFDPQTRAQAKEKSRVLVCDGFATHETLEVLEYCFENNIILCRLPSHTSHKLQPCDIAVFGPLKAAYRDQVERLERGGVGAIGKEHFTSLYNAARRAALTPRNIRAGWSKAGLFPFNATRVIQDLPQPLANDTTLNPPEPPTDVTRQDDIPQTPVTPVSSEAVASLQRLIEQDAHHPDERSKQRLRKRLQKLTNATQLSFAECALLEEQNRFLYRINNEAKVRRSTKSEFIRTARVMSYEDLERARTARKIKEAEKAAKKARNKIRKRDRDSMQIDQDGPGGMSRNLLEDLPGEEPNVVEDTQASCRSDRMMDNGQCHGDADFNMGSAWEIDVGAEGGAPPKSYSVPVARM